MRRTLLRTLWVEALNAEWQQALLDDGFLLRLAVERRT
jgi:hypothetical protein